MKKFITNKVITTLFSATSIMLVVSCGTTTQQEASTLTPTITIKAYHHKNLQQIFSNHEYSWSQLHLGVPPLVLKKFPDDLHRITTTQQKKNLFFSSILPMAMLANEEISQQRATLDAIFQNFDQMETISTQQKKEIDEITARYRVKKDPLTNASARAMLFRRVDTIPESLVLAQAANESGWGTSRFSRQANNIFGEWTFTPGQGIVPENRPEGEIYEVRRFPSLYQSVRSYMRNINTHRAYTSLRKKREELRRSSLDVSGVKLSLELDNYSTRRQAYSREIQALIKANRLEELTSVTYLREDALTSAKSETNLNAGLFTSKEFLKKRFIAQ
jgi:Bax protein